MNKNKINIALTKQVLYYIAKSIVVVAGGIAGTVYEISPVRIHRQVFGNSESFALEERYQQERRVKRAIDDLKKRKFLEIKEKGGKMFYALTEKGISEALLAKIKLQPKISSGNKFCLVCFDIPEVVKDSRWALRHFLKSVGFKQLQKSIWYTDQNIFDEVEEYIKTLKVADWVRVIHASSISNIGKLA